MAFGTSHVALLHRAKLRKGQTALILGAAGGVGTAAVQVSMAESCAVMVYMQRSATVLRLCCRSYIHPFYGNIYRLQGHGHPWAARVLSLLAQLHGRNTFHAEIS